MPAEPIAAPITPNASLSRFISQIRQTTETLLDACDLLEAELATVVPPPPQPPPSMTQAQAIPPRQQPAREALASQSQMSAIGAERIRLGWDHVTLDKLVRELFTVVSVPALNEKQATQLIAHLANIGSKDAPETPSAGPEQPERDEAEVARQDLAADCLELANGVKDAAALNLWMQKKYGSDRIFELTEPQLKHLQATLRQKLSTVGAR
jgi:hypothetical protein